MGLFSPCHGRVDFDLAAPAPAHIAGQVVRSSLRLLRHCRYFLRISFQCCPSPAAIPASLTALRGA